MYKIHITLVLAVSIVFLSTVFSESKQKPTLTPNLVNGLWSRIGKRSKQFDCNQRFIVNQLDIESLDKVIKCLQIRSKEGNKKRCKCYLV